MKASLPASALFCTALVLSGCQSIGNPLPANDKTLSTATTLSINPELLARYEWHLDSAVANHYDQQGKLINRAPISDFYHPNYPISFEAYHQNKDGTQDLFIGFNAHCNDSNAPYFLLKDNTLKIGMIISTMMGCGMTGNRIEKALFDLMRGSSSTLTLSMRPQSATGSAGDYPRYNLLQTMATGETLVWQNVPKKVFNPPTDNHDNK